MRERHSEWRTSALELQTEQAKRETAKANEAAAGLNERAASLEREAAALRLQLDREIQKRAQRILQGEQRAAMVAELKGKITEIALVVQNDLETQAFSVQFLSIFAEIGATIYAPEPPAEDKWWAPTGLIMYSPLGSNEDQLQDDPLYRALKQANLFGGTTSQPFTSARPRGPIPAVIPGYNGHVLYIGQKSPF